MPRPDGLGFFYSGGLCLCRSKPTLLVQPGFRGQGCPFHKNQSITSVTLSRAQITDESKLLDENICRRFSGSEARLSVLCSDHSFDNPGGAKILGRLGPGST